MERSNEWPIHWNLLVEYWHIITKKNILPTYNIGIKLKM